MKELNEHIEFLEMTESDPQLLVWLLELRRHRQDDWKQRAEAAEERASNLDDNWLNCVTQRDEARCQRDALQAKLDELAKRKPCGYHSTDARAVFRVWPYADGKICVPVYSRPVPAVSLAELVPNPSDNKYWGNDGHGTRFKVQTYHDDVLASLRNIEEAK